MVRYAALAALALNLGVLGMALPKDRPRRQSSGSNVLVIMTDDQDQLLDSVSVMPQVKNLIGSKGVTYEKHYCTVAWCCPSRVNFFTGRAAHNTNVTSVKPPYGGWSKFTEQGLNDHYLPVWISSSGIGTYYVGKFMNGFGKKSLADPEPPAGWTDSSFLVGPWEYDYYNSHWTNGVNARSMADVTSFPGIHTTDVTEQKALAMLDDAAKRGGQFYMQVAPVAPHVQEGGGPALPPVPFKYKGVFSDRQVPRSENFNPDEPSGASWVYNMPQQTADQVAFGDQMYSHRLGNLAAIDDMVGKLIEKLDEHDLLDNTCIIYTTDNGFHIGNHRLTAGKRCPYEEDINIPLLIRGPDVAQGKTSKIVNSHTDMAPTILKLLGLPLQSDFDGAPIAYTEKELGSSTKHELVNVEFWNSDIIPVGMAKDSYYNNTYKALRLISDDYSFLYTIWCSGEREFYDMNVDPSQMFNRLATPPKGSASNYYSRSEGDLFHRLDTLLMVTKSCSQNSCRDPWSVIFPSGNVNSLTDAMKDKYDSFFADQPKVSFSSCIQGQIISEEGPMNVHPFSGSGHG